jgi:hypothetical protein
MLADRDRLRPNGFGPGSGSRSGRLPPHVYQIRVVSVESDPVAKGLMRLRQRGHTPRYWALNRALQTHTALAQTARRSVDSLPHLHVSTTQPDQFSKDILRTAEHWCAIPRLNHRQFREDMQALGLLFCRVCGGVDDGVGAADRCRLSRAAWRGGGVIGDLSSGSPTCRPDARRAMLPDRLVRLRDSVSANSFQPHHSS